jgi:hypothetical protein
MATQAQLAANRANAQQSTGPRSVEGKSVSRFNALKHGVDAASPVIPGEDPAEYQELAAEYQRRFQPETPDERYHVQTMIDSDWQKRRLGRLETECYEVLDTEAPGMSLAAAILSASPAAKLLARTQRQLAGHQRAWYRAYTELRLQREREEDDDGVFQPYEEFEDRNEPNSEVGAPACDWTALPEQHPAPACDRRAIREEPVVTLNQCSS